MFKCWTFFFVFLIPIIAIGKADKDKPDNSPQSKIKRDIDYIIADRVQGRLTASSGETIVADYIEGRFRSLQILPYKNKYKWEFTTKVGMKVGADAYFHLFNNELTLGNEVIVLPYGNGNLIRGAAMPGVNEKDNVWLLSLKSFQAAQTNNLQKLLYEQAKLAIDQGAASVVFLNDIDVFQDIVQLNLTQFEALDKPVVFLTHKAYNAYLKPNLKKDWIIVDGKLGFEESHSTGKNVAAMIDNKAPFTVVIAAHFDHLGNLGANYKGADDNASGVAGLLAIAEQIKIAGLRNYNYLFIAFSGKEQNLQGSKNFLQQNEFIINSIACMIDLDMIGRYNISTKDIYLAGYGTSPSWASILQLSNRGMNIRIDSSGYNYSDCTTFYEKNIPVLRISTGYHNDYMKPTDDISKLNLNGIVDIAAFVTRIVGEIDRRSKPIFTKTTDLLPKLEKMKSNIGIIPDFTYTGQGIKIAAVIPNKVASTAGMMSGDIITKIGVYTLYDMDDYMEAMKKTEQGREVTVIAKRDKSEFKFFVVL